MLEQIRAAGGEVFAITSEPQTLATEAQESCGIQFVAIGDPHHEIRDDCAERGLVDVFYNTIPGDKNMGFRDVHPKGFFQPAVRSVHKSGRVLYRWRCVAKHSNMSGAGPRPEAAYAWDKIKAAMDSEHDAELDKNPVLGEKSKSWYQFLLMLLAHGWFLRPKTFALAREGDEKRPVAWAAKVTPGLIEIYDQFPNAPDPF
ncbi:MAG: hypothetical protein P8L31_08400 [Pseudomonadales bacterium]|nr:hypothetical protein [Pseudomonadales bacterium]